MAGLASALAASPRGRNLQRLVQRCDKIPGHQRTCGRRAEAVSARPAGGASASTCGHMARTCRRCATGVGAAIG